MSIGKESFISAPRDSFSSTVRASETGRATSIRFDVPVRDGVANPNRTRL